MRIKDLLSESELSEISLKGFGDYPKKARMSQAMAQMNKGFGYPGDHDKTIAKREKGLASHKARVDKFWAEKNAKDQAEREQAMRHKYAGVDIDAEIEKLKPALQRAYNDYQYGARNTYSQAHDEYNRISARIRELEQAKKFLGEMATSGATNAASMGTVENPGISPGPARGKKSYTGSPGKSGTKAPAQPKVKQPKNPDGTAVNGLDMKGANLFGGGTVKRS